MLLTAKVMRKAGLAFERKLLKAFEPYAPKAQVPAGGGYADFVLYAAPVSPLVVEAKRTLRLDALAQVQRYAAALGIVNILLVAQRLAAPPEAFGAPEVLVALADLRPGINVMLWRN